MTEAIDKAADELADARLEFAIAESNLAAARADLTRAERNYRALFVAASQQHPAQGE